MDAQTDLGFVENGSLMMYCYIQEILAEHILPLAPCIGDNFLLTEDNVCPHVARCVLQYLNEVGIQSMQWSARSPDLNPIGHI